MMRMSTSRLNKQKISFFGLALVCEMIVPAAICGASTEVSGESGKEIGMIFDCSHNFNQELGGNQACLTVSGLKFSISESLHSNLTAKLSIAPFATLNSRYDQSVAHIRKPYIRENSLLGPIGDYSITWKPRKNLQVALELYSGASYFPNTSRLSLAPFFADHGWKQSAISIAYKLPMLEGVNVKFVGGNGEGEIDRNQNPQQYFGFELHGEVLIGLEVHSGLSIDGNDSGSRAWEWRRKEQGLESDLSAKTGFTTRRLSFAIETNGRLPFAQGLRAGVGIHRSIYADLNKDEHSEASFNDLESTPRIDPDLLMLEDPSFGNANAMEVTTLGINASYLILDSYFIGFDYAKKKNVSDVKFFQSCDSFDGTRCVNPSGPQNYFEVRATTIGFGFMLNDGLQLSLAYNSTNYSQLYRKIYFEGPSNSASSSRDLFNARVSYNWN